MEIALIEFIEDTVITIITIIAAMIIVWGAKQLTDKEYILNELDARTLLEQLAEESAELGQAALKYIRAHELNKNYTPKTEEEAELDLQEEFTDVCCVANMLGLVAGENNRKLEVGCADCN